MYAFTPDFLVWISDPPFWQDLWDSMLPTSTCLPISLSKDPGSSNSRVVPTPKAKGTGEGEVTGTWRGREYCRAGYLEKSSDVLLGEKRTSPLPFSSAGVPIGQTQEEVQDHRNPVKVLTFTISILETRNSDSIGDFSKL